MKQFLLAFFMLVTSIAMAQSPIQFANTKHSFGKITQNIPQSYIFTFKNQSLKPLVVEVATAECGCTTPEYPKEPIAKGKEGKIKVTYNAAAAGAFSKKVTVKFAGTDEPTTLTIEGIVVEKKG